MKFEKFLKGCGTHGVVIERTEAEKWLVCGGVGMIIPRGVDNLLGSAKEREYASIVDVISNMELDDRLSLVRAEILEPTGNAQAIYRVFESELGEIVAIINADYGLLEKTDRLGYGEIGIPAEGDRPERTIKYVLVYDQNNNIRGFITGSDRF